MNLLEPIQVAEERDIPPEEMTIKVSLKRVAIIEIQRSPEGNFGILVNDELVIVFDDHDRARDFAAELVDAKRNMDPEDDPITVVFEVDKRGTYLP